MMKSILISARTIIGICLMTSAGAAAEEAVSDRAAQLLVRRCLECHSGAESQGKLDLTSRAAIIRGGESGPVLDESQAEKSLIWTRVAADEMPPKKPLLEEEKQLLRSWLNDGARYAIDPLSPWEFTTPERAGKDWWSLQPLQHVIPPDLLNAAAALSPIDAFHQHGLQTAGLKASSQVDRRVLIRRITFDLIGLPPTPEEIDEFLVDDSADACERLTDRLLASPHYGERWTRHWLDVVRFGESNGFERDLPRPNAWHYRDWVIAAFNADLPYAEFVRRQIAGAADDPHDAAASLGFLVAGPHDTVVPASDNMRKSMRFDELEDVLGTIGQTFLGLTINCARCHDHKFDPISQTEYYQLAATLDGVDHGERELTSVRVSQDLAATREQIQKLTQELNEQTRRAMARIKKNKGVDDSKPIAPIPLAAWDFTRPLADQPGAPEVTLHSTAKLMETGLVVDGSTGYAATAPLAAPLREKTLSAKVRLTNLTQQGGGVISVQSLDGVEFDAIVFGEQQAGRWMPGSNGFVRTQSLQAAEETEADRDFVTIALVYAADGTITGYRNGQRYGKPYASNGPLAFAAEKSQFVFGLRHAPAGGNRMLAGVIAAAKVYDRALSADEVAAAAAEEAVVTEANILRQLTEDQRKQRQSQRDELAALREREAALVKEGSLKIYTAQMSQPGPMAFLRRGNVTEPGPVVSPASLAAAAVGKNDFRLSPDAPEQQRRIVLAEWLTASDNALAARTIVNRLWHYHFGSGFIETPNDLGFNGGRPSHTELFEWLCGEFQRTNGGIKQFHRLLMNSAVYRQSSAMRHDAYEKDAGNRQLWRMNPRRLEAESVRDAMLCVSGELNDTLGGSSYQDFNSYFFKGTQFYEPADADEANVRRRTVYRMWARGGRSPFLDTFDCPDPSTPTPKRSTTTTPLQALALMNNAFSLRRAEGLAARVEAMGTANSQAKIAGVYRFAYGREPQADELAAAIKFVERRGLTEFCRVILNSSEFLYVE